MTGALSSGLYTTRTGMDEAKQLIKQVSKVFPIMFAVRLEQHKERKDEIKGPRLIILCVVD